MKFHATNDQLREIAALAFNASIPMGMGFLHYVPGTRRGADFAHINVGGGLNLDYVEGRMVKLNLYREEDGSLTTPAQDPRVDYQSWAVRYPTYAALLSAAGVDVSEAAA